MTVQFRHMKHTNKVPYQAPGIGDLDLLLERALLNTSWLDTPVDSQTNEGVTWITDY